jgi:hypothetical protein
MTSVVVGVSFGGLFDPWQQKELMLAQLRVSRARTEAGQDKALQASSALHDKFLASNAAAAAKEREARGALAMKVFIDAKKEVADSKQVAKEAMACAKEAERMAEHVAKEAKKMAEEADGLLCMAQEKMKKALKAEADARAKVRWEAKLHSDFLAQFSMDDILDEEEEEEEEEYSEEQLEYWWNQMEHDNCL